MFNKLKDLGKSETQIQSEEYFTLRTKLHKDNAFKSPQERSEAAKRMFELREILNRKYLASRGL